VINAEAFSYILEGQGRREDLILARDKEIIEQCKARLKQYVSEYQGIRLESIDMDQVLDAVLMNIEAQD